MKIKTCFFVVLSTLILSITCNIVLGIILAKSLSETVSFDDLRVSLFELTIEYNLEKNYATCFSAYEKGIYVTNYHSFTFCEDDIENAQITIKDHESNVCQVDLYGFNKDKDIALLKSDEFFSKNIIELSESNPKTGDLCYSFANANGLGISLYDGLISNPSIELIVDGCSQKYIQSNLPAYPGCSGGCLLDKKGFCIGMVSFRIKDKNGDPIIDFSYSIPSNTLREEINNILGEPLK